RGLLVEGHSRAELRTNRRHQWRVSPGDQEPLAPGAVESARDNRSVLFGDAAVCGNMIDENAPSSRTICARSVATADLSLSGRATRTELSHLRTAAWFSLSILASSSRNLAAFSGCCSKSYSSIKSLRAFTSQLTLGSICLTRMSYPARVSTSASDGRC